MARIFTVQVFLYIYTVKYMKIVTYPDDVSASACFSALLIYESVSKYASIKCLCDNSRHAVILLTFSAWMAYVHERGLFLKVQSETLTPTSKK